MASSASERGTSPPSTPAVPVPLITPRYQKKQRAPRAMTLTNNTEPCTTATAIGKERTIETLSIRNGEVEYEETVRFHTYELFRLGKYQIHSKSVGYSSDGDLVLVREQLSHVSESENELSRKVVQIGAALCMNPQAKRPLTDTEMVEAAAGMPALKGNKAKKYPGVKCPRNRKVRNRLANDHFSAGFAKALYEQSQQQYEEGDDDDPMDCAQRAVFGSLPDSFAHLLHVEEARQEATFTKAGISPVLKPADSRDPNAGESRFQLLPSNLRAELQHALASEFLTNQINDLEKYFAEYIAQPPEDGSPMSFIFRDGYSRLICHGVASYYQLVSRSDSFPDGTRHTTVTFPKGRRELQLPLCTLLNFLTRRGKGGSSPPPPPFSLEDDSLTTTKMTATQKKKLRRQAKRGGQ